MPHACVAGKGVNNEHWHARWHVAAVIGRLTDKEQSAIAALFAAGREDGSIHMGEVDSAVINADAFTSWIAEQGQPVRARLAEVQGAFTMAVTNTPGGSAYMPFLPVLRQVVTLHGPLARYIALEIKPDLAMSNFSPAFALVNSSASARLLDGVKANTWID
ncbi:MAG: hypothetical protein HZT43_03555 [Exiguobacterium profundum]|nr:MAG: hypothetical protein HZT43_03555 [Exiguobacterium profundum]